MTISGFQIGNGSGDKPDFTEFYGASGLTAVIPALQKEARLHQFPISLPKPEECAFGFRPGECNAHPLCSSVAIGYPVYQPFFFMSAPSLSPYLACYPSSHLHLHPLWFMRCTKVESELDLKILLQSVLQKMDFSRPSWVSL